MVSYRYGVLQERIRKIEKSIRQSVVGALDKTADATRDKLDAVVATWENQPAFSLSRSDTPSRFRRTILIEGNPRAVRIWGYVDKGTRPHEIRPKTAGGVLAFKPGFQAKTAFRGQFGGAGKSFGSTVYRRAVKHPGSRARDFSGKYREEAAAQLPEEIRKRL